MRKVPVRTFKASSAVSNQGGLMLNPNRGARSVKMVKAATRQRTAPATHISMHLPKTPSLSPSDLDSGSRIQVLLRETPPSYPTPVIRASDLAGLPENSGA